MDSIIRYNSLAEYLDALDEVSKTTYFGVRYDHDVIRMKYLRRTPYVMPYLFAFPVSVDETYYRFEPKIDFPRFDESKYSFVGQYDYVLGRWKDLGTIAEWMKNRYISCTNNPSAI